MQWFSPKGKAQVLSNQHEAKRATTEKVADKTRSLGGSDPRFWSVLPPKTISGVATAQWHTTRARCLVRGRDPRQRQKVFLVVGEIHNPRKPVPSETPRWLIIPQRGLFTGIVIIGAVGTGKTSSCMYPFVEQLVAYKAQDAEKKVGALVLEDKAISAIR